MIVLFLTGMVGVIIVRVLRRDISNYNQLESGEDAQEETGWKLVGACGSGVLIQGHVCQ
jgi:transmembrane 9 superfamily protein 2/4